MTPFSHVMTTYFTTLAIGLSVFLHPSPTLLWNASTSTPIGLYAVRPTGVLHVSELVVIRPPEPLASFLVDRSYLPKAVPRVVALPRQTVCRVGRTITVDAIAMGVALEADRRGSLGALPRDHARRSLRDEFAVRGLPRRPLFRAASGLRHRRSRRSSLDARQGLTMPPTGSRHAASASPPLPPPSSFPAIHPSLARYPTATRRLRSRAVACVGIVAFLAFSAHHAVAQAASAEVSDAVGIDDLFAVFIAEASLRFGLPASAIRAAIQAESRGDVQAVSPKGAMGLMQIMPKTWSGLRFRYGLGADPFDPHDNIVAGTPYLRELHDRYGDPGFLAAYNAGPARYEAHLAAGVPLTDETRAMSACSLR